MKHLPQTPRTQRGLSLVEMMVGVAIGLFVIAAAATLVSMQLGDNRRILLETQVQQDLRATADIITRELRRAGHWSNAEDGLATPTTAPASNAYLNLSLPSNSEVGYEYQRATGVSGPFGFKLETGVIKTRLAGATGWQELTDKNVLVIDDLDIALDDSAVVRLPCPTACPSPLPVGALAADYCWPQIGVRSLLVTITGHALSDPAVKRTVQSQVRLRNDEVRFRAGTPAGSQVCPS